MFLWTASPVSLHNRALTRNPLRRIGKLASVLEKLISGNYLVDKADFQTYILGQELPKTRPPPKGVMSKIFKCPRCGIELTLTYDGDQTGSFNADPQTWRAHCQDQSAKIGAGGPGLCDYAREALQEHFPRRRNT